MPTIKLNEKGEATVVPYANDGWMKTFRRDLINGPPMSGKTTSLMTWPACPEAKRHIMVAQDEQGYSSIQEDDSTVIYTWELESPGVPLLSLWNHFKRVTKEILDGKHGPVGVFAIDGLHKLVHMLMKLKGWPNGVDFDANSYGKGYGYVANDYHEYMMPILLGSTQYVVATCYDSDKAIEAGSKDKAKFPAFPGQIGRLVLGQFPLVLHTKKVGFGPTEEYLWELEARGQMRAAGVHLPMRIKKQLPATVKQNWIELEKLIIDASEPVPEKKLYRTI